MSTGPGGWRHGGHWAELPRPLPDRPPPAGWPVPAPPDAPVPPDPLLRELWLIRAELAMLAARGRSSMPRLAPLAAGVCLSVGAIVGLAGAASVGDDPSVGWPLVAVGAVVVGLGLWAVWAAVRRVRRAVRRQFGLMARERELSGLDAARPGGPYGGPSTANRQWVPTLPATSTGVYRPPLPPDAPATPFPYY